MMNKDCNCKIPKEVIEMFDGRCLMIQKEFAETICACYRYRVLMDIFQEIPLTKKALEIMNYMSGDERVSVRFRLWIDRKILENNKKSNEK